MTVLLDNAQKIIVYVITQDSGVFKAQDQPLPTSDKAKANMFDLLASGLQYLCSPPLLRQLIQDSVHKAMALFGAKVLT